MGAPDRARTRWAENALPVGGRTGVRHAGGATPGTLVGLALWGVGSVVFSGYVSNFGSYNETYGSLAAVIVLMLWLYLSAFAILVGAEVDAVRERDEHVIQTTHPGQ